jgi:hypothetical protein
MERTVGLGSILCSIRPELRNSYGIDKRYLWYRDFSVERKILRRLVAAPYFKSIIVSALRNYGQEGRVQVSSKPLESARGSPAAGMCPTTLEVSRRRS